jgi:molybdopterin-synthase adenylyltransferase
VWSARAWIRPGSDYRRDDCATVRIAGDRLAITHLPTVSPAPTLDERLLRIVRLVQADLARLRIGMIGVGSVGSMVAEALAHTGVGQLLLVDFDSIKHDLELVFHATRRDIALARSRST